MVRILSISLALLYTVSLFAPLIPYMEYTVHKEHIMSHHCENPDSDCEGTCYLKKQVENHQTDYSFVVQHLFQILFIGEHDSEIYAPLIQSIVSHLFSEDLIDSPPYTLLQPPQA